MHACMLLQIVKVKMVESGPGTTPDCARSSPAQSTAYKDNINHVHTMSGSIAALLKDAFFGQRLACRDYALLKTFVGSVQDSHPH